MVTSDDAQASGPRHEGRLSNIPAHLRIEILYEDEWVVVINKPCNLRSVPGHAQAPTSFERTPAKRPRVSRDDTTAGESNRLTAQEAWIAAIRSCVNLDGDDDSLNYCLGNLATATNLNSVPRKWKLFHRYIQRNQHRLLRIEKESLDDSLKPERSLKDNRLDGSIVESMARLMYATIEGRQRPLLNLPESTRHEESAIGQLILMGYADEESSSFLNTTMKRLYVVHRLDCETSGVMVFARDEDSASSLCRAWRERSEVLKTYLARVRDWPPYHEGKETEGRIELPLAPSEERIKWQVKQGGKPSTTLWKVNRRNSAPNDTLVLELTPVTGRTHQLRIHCATIGSGIEGDSLYGDQPINLGGGERLCLHAHKLCFPHPKYGKSMEFASLPLWE